MVLGNDRKEVEESKNTATKYMVYTTVGDMQQT